MHQEPKTLDPKFFQSLVEIIAADLNKNVNITDDHGIIIASHSKERIGQLHEAGANMLNTKSIAEFSVNAADEKTLSGVRRGYNVPIMFEDKCIGLIGVSGEPEEAALYARLAAHFVETALQSNVEHIKLVKALQEKQDLRLDYLKRIMHIQEEERQSISRELHDETSQSLTSIIFGLRVLAETHNGEERKKILKMRDLAANTLDAVHSLAVRLRPLVLDKLGLVTAVKKYIEDFSQQYSITVHTTFSNKLALQRFSQEIEINLYRILQETLTNIARHAHATTVDITLAKKKDTLIFTIADDGAGFDIENVNKRTRTSLGLYGIRERVALFNGSIAIHSAISQGTKITIKIPLT
ncbi:MAG: histidine kinase [Pelosinus sp.]|nr:histidine kinase [Pelosinus sp.]